MSPVPICSAPVVARIQENHPHVTSLLPLPLQSYYGGLLCCDWSADGEFIATGGEDDLVCVYSIADRAVVAWGAGHASWVSAVAFDSW